MKNKSTVIKIVLLALLVFAVVFILIKYDINYRTYQRHFNDIRRYIYSFGNFAVLIYLLIFSIRTLLVVFPYSAMVILGGSIFGPVMGFIFSMLGVFISATLAYYISKYFGKDFVQKLIRGKLKGLDTKVEEHGFKIVFFMRLSTLFPYDITNFALGLTKVRYKDFILGTTLGILAETFALNYLGFNLRHPFSPRFILAIILLAVTVAIPLLYSKYYKNNNEQNKKNVSEEQEADEPMD